MTPSLSWTTVYSGRPLAEPFYRPSAPSCAATTAGSTLSHPGTRAGGQRGEVPEEGLSLERAPGEGRVHRCPGRAITDADVLGTLLVQNPSLRVLSMGAPTLAPPPKTPRVLSPARPSLHSSNTPLFSCWSRIACAREGTGVRTRQDAETQCTINQGRAHGTARQGG